METENRIPEQANLINWGMFEVKNKEDSIEVEVGKKYELGFYSLKQGSMEVVDKEKTAEGKVEVKKTIPTLILGVDFHDGKPCKKEILFTSKKLAADIRTYFEKDMLFKRVFQLDKSGSGFQTVYRLIALNDKPKA
jgi:hypothetical protein